MGTTESSSDRHSQQKITQRESLARTRKRCRPAVERNNRRRNFSVDSRNTSESLNAWRQREYALRRRTSYDIAEVRDAWTNTFRLRALHCLRVCSTSFQLRYREKKPSTRDSSLVDAVGDEDCLIHFSRMDRSAYRNDDQKE